MNDRCRLADAAALINLMLICQGGAQCRALYVEVQKMRSYLLQGPQQPCKVAAFDHHLDGRLLVLQQAIALIVCHASNEENAKTAKTASRFTAAMETISAVAASFGGTKAAVMAAFAAMAIAATINVKLMTASATDSPILLNLLRFSRAFSSSSSSLFHSNNPSSSNPCHLRISSRRSPALMSRNGLPSASSGASIVMVFLSSSPSPSPSTRCFTSER
uniref:VAN3-binding protein-like auxin canalisation domain-containing protein n=1 Tax=Ananas comosus var. bracteatus TaxID=296719 RepID=A0A6V7PQZ4_ANACO|nr:unnamed protein product [Ananas comosus var. bracteatus]